MENQLGECSKNLTEATSVGVTIKKERTEEEIDVISDDSDSEEREYYFESDHVALRGNVDYSNLLKTLTLLEAQRIRATKDIEKLAAMETLAIHDTDKFLEKLKSGELDIPGPIQIAEIPKIDFGKYNVEFPRNQESYNQNPKPQDTTAKGRVLEDSGKPETFNKLWTFDEQRRLEELLVEYPSEPIEARRFAKIARALGNRTTKQVASRVQKYFKKLHSIGMPIPGRIPKSRGRYYANVKSLYKPSTFFPAYDVPVKMPDEDESFVFGGPVINNIQSQKASYSSSTSVTQDTEQDTDNFSYIVVDECSDDEACTNKIKPFDENSRVLKLVQRVKRDKEKETFSRLQSKHIDFECDLCKENPIIGTRWHCYTCTINSVDFCSDCLVSQALSDYRHPLSHKIIGLRVHMYSKSKTNTSSENEVESEEEEENANMDKNIHTYRDKDYLASKFFKNGECNYLDPNFF